MAYANNGYDNGNGNGQQQDFFDLGHKSYNMYSGTLKFVPNYDGKAPTLMLQVAKAINPGQKNTPCDWQNSIYFAMNVVECASVAQWADDIAAGLTAEAFSTVHKTQTVNKGIYINLSNSQSGKRTYYVNITDNNNNNKISIGISGAEWSVFVGACRFMAENAIGIRSVLAEVAKISKGNSDFLAIANKKRQYNNGGQQGGYQPQQPPQQPQFNNSYQPRQFPAPRNAQMQQNYQPQQMPQQQQFNQQDEELLL